MSQWILPAALGAAGLGLVVVGSAARKRSPGALVSSALASELAQAVTVPPMRGQLSVTPLTTEPTLEELAGVVGRARFYGPMDGEDNEGGGYKDKFSQHPSGPKGVEAILAAGNGQVWSGKGWVDDPEQARWWLIRSLLEAVEVGVDRGSIKPSDLLAGLYGWTTPETQTEMAGATIKFSLAYLLSPTLFPDIRQRANMLYLATQDLILRPDLEQYAQSRWFGQSWAQAGGGRSEATGTYFRKRSSRALWGGVIHGLAVWQGESKGKLEQLMADWRALYGVPDLTIGKATVPQLATLIVSLATLFMRLAADKTAQWPAGAPSKVDTWGAVQQVMGAFFSASVAAFTGNYMAYADIVLETAGVGPIPPKAKEVIEGGASYLAQL